MRIITGSARGRKLETLPGDDITRPTGEKVKEAMFSMIQFDIEGRKVLEPFGGSGQLSLEALSRGADFAVIGDADAGAAVIIKKNAQKTGLYDKTRVATTDYKNLIKSSQGREKFDIVFLDPPYASGLIPDCLDRLVRADVLNPFALVICESDSAEPFEHEAFEVKSFHKYGKVFVTLLCKKDGEPEAAE